MALYPARFQRDTATEEALVKTIQEALDALKALQPPIPELTRAYSHLGSVLGGVRGELQQRQPFYVGYDITLDATVARWRVGETAEEIQATGQNERTALVALITALGERLNG